MRRLLPLIASLMVVLTFWSASAAFASDGVGPAMVGSAIHFEGDRDQVPADDHKSVPHHHGACHADTIGLPAGLAPVSVDTQHKSSLHPAPPHSLPSAEPDTSLRPPIA